MRTIAVVTVGRSDYGIYLPILRRIRESSELNLQLIAAGMHLSPGSGHTVDAIVADGFAIAERVELSPVSDAPEEVAKAMGLGTTRYAKALAHLCPDILVLLGDRFEMHSAAVAAVPLKIPIAHIHGGELTLGAMDDALRHSMTKLSHLHFVSTAAHGRRVAQMGEEDWRIVVSGAPGLDYIRKIDLLNATDFANRFGLPPGKRFLLVTYHPATLDSVPVEDRFAHVLQALKASGETILFTQANADPGGQAINRMIHECVGDDSNAYFVANLGTPGYFSAMSLAAAMVGNSSSGIIEAASFHLPVVNIGDRQQGRSCGANVIHSGYDPSEIHRAIEKGCSVAFREQIAAEQNCYGDGNASRQIVETLATVSIDEKLLMKKFHDLK